jgi:hypothetical protein
MKNINEELVIFGVKLGKSLINFQWKYYIRAKLVYAIKGTYSVLARSVFNYAAFKWTEHIHASLGPGRVLLFASL